MKNGKKMSILIFLLAFLTIPLAIAWSGAKVGQKAPALQFNDETGVATGLDQFKGKVVLLNLWATWCKPCQKELPEMNALAKKLNGEKAVVVAINLDDDSEAGKKFLNQLAPLHIKPFFDPTQSVPAALGVEAMPSSFVIDKTGAIVYINAGFKSGDIEKMEKLIKELSGK